MFLTLGCSCCCGRYVARYYLAVKDALVRESYRLGYLSKRRATQLGKPEHCAPIVRLANP